MCWFQITQAKHWYLHWIFFDSMILHHNFYEIMPLKIPMGLEWHESFLIFRFFCYICVREFSSRKYLQKHNGYKHWQTKYQCEKCGQQVLWTNRAAHITQLHTDERLFKCEHADCTSRFKDNRQLKIHIRSHFPGAYECNECNKTYKSLYNIKHHLSEHFPELLKIFKCTICPMKFTAKHVFRDHFAGHNPDQKLYRCKKCPASFSRSCSLYGHVDKVHKRIRYHCKHCEKNYADKKSLFVHVFNHRGDKPVSWKKVRSDNFLFFNFALFPYM
jgi:hypothetical protein